MSDFGFGGMPSMTQLRTLLTNTSPAPEAVAAATGAGQYAARDDHKHERLSSVTVQTLGANGDQTITFTRSFASMPGVICTAYKASDNLPVTFEVKSWVQDAQGNYTGCVIHGSKAQTLPTVIALLSALVGFNIFAGNAVGTQFSCIAIQASNIQPAN
jgi:hypothetical protein